MFSVLLVIVFENGKDVVVPELKSEYALPVNIGLGGGADLLEDEAAVFCLVLGTLMARLAIEQGEM